MSKKILIDAVYPGETRVVIYDNNIIQDFDYENSHNKQLKGNIYLARVTRVEPSLQAAFIEYGGSKHGFLPFSEIHPTYFFTDKDAKFPQQNNGSSLADKLHAISLPEVNEEESVKGNGVEVRGEAVSSLTKEVIKEVEVDTEKYIDADDKYERDNKDKSDSDAKVDLVSDEEDSISEEYDGGGAPRQSIHDQYKIQDVIKKGQVILIQVLKEERGNKGAACTSYISLAGRYCVFMPNSEKQGGISRRIVNISDRKNLRDTISSLKIQDGVSIIIRTAGAGKHPNDIRRDYYYLARLWNAIREHAIKAKVNSFIHAESDLLKRTIRDLYNSEIEEIQIQGNESFRAAKEFMRTMLPLHAHKIREYKAKVPIFTKFNVEEKISALYVPTVNLPSGGYIVINPTEALIAIDVNSGRATNERNIEETATKTNIEAAVEVAKQLRLRDMSGLIVIDFIDMVEASNRKTVEMTLRDAFQVDRAKVQLGNISAFGLLELSRQRLQSSFMEANTSACPSCSGKGHIKSFDSNSLMILRTIEGEIYQGDCDTLNVYAHPDIILHLLNHKREPLVRLEKLYRCRIIFHKEDTVQYDGFSIEKVERERNSNNKPNSGPTLNDVDHMEAYNQDVFEDNVVRQEAQLGLGEDLAPYQVNDESIIDDNPPPSIRHRVRKGPAPSHNKRRRISGDHADKLESGDRSHNSKPYNKNRSNRYKNNRRNYDSRNKQKPESSTLKKWWDKLTK